MSGSSTSSDSEFDESLLVRDFEEESQLIINNLLPSKSSTRYNLTYSEFIKWIKDNNVNSISERSLLVYFQELSKTLAPSTLWARWSMLKTTLLLRENVNMDNFVMLKAYLKNKNKGFKSKKSKVFTWTEVKKFLDDADDNIYLAIKAILIFGISGAMRCCEIVSLKLSDVEDTGEKLIVKIEDTKTYYARSFIIGDLFYGTVKKYMALRPEKKFTDRFFINYHKGKCTLQHIGIHKVAEVPKTIALYLNLNEPDRYTGHRLRRTSATLLSNSGANLTAVKQLGGWKSSKVAEGYIENSLAVKNQIFDGLTKHVNKIPAIASTSASNPHNKIQTPTNAKPKLTAIPSTSKAHNEANLKMSEKTTTVTRIPLKPIENNQIQENKRKNPETINDQECDSLSIQANASIDDTNKNKKNCPYGCAAVKMINCEIKQFVINNNYEKNEIP